MGSKTAARYDSRLNRQTDTNPSSRTQEKKCTKETTASTSSRIRKMQAHSLHAVFG